MFFLFFNIGYIVLYEIFHIDICSDAASVVIGHTFVVDSG
ncbi:hypothetical protein CLV42_103277 [Chitinophaga ginsengisoli]|uniref:Uncharacterized protein n=1 Tax=Chitinophaga ginsengisoli TaxID=363837 RepID=A0A2P8GH47_9BACT|nr:hypothetical protein CLV42_103277 [Chitinophaga ginsengisoli]